MISRSDYMDNSSELHHQYFSQFVTPATISFVNSQIGLTDVWTDIDFYFKSRSNGGVFLRILR